MARSPHRRILLRFYDQDPQHREILRWLDGYNGAILQSVLRQALEVGLPQVLGETRPVFVSDKKPPLAIREALADGNTLAGSDALADGEVLSDGKASTDSDTLVGGDALASGEVQAGNEPVAGDNPLVERKPLSEPLAGSDQASNDAVPAFLPSSDKASLHIRQVMDAVKGLNR